MAYIDDSRDPKLACFSALVIPAVSWPQFHDDIIAFRRKLKQTDGIHVTKELHATEFLSGRGNLGAMVTKWRRARIFEEVMDFLASRNDLRILNACVPRKDEEKAFERLIDRLNVHMKKKSNFLADGDMNAQVIVIIDQGKDYTGIVRRMRRFNMMPSKFGWWPGVGASKNKPITQVIEDLVFRDSKKSSFIQFADFCAYALLRSENQLPPKNVYNIQMAFDRLKPVLETRAFGGDPRKLGIIRET
ncbi:MAG TPA: DUF3800 domain-containing protein [Verrucomicrobiae bacterium]|nr:DUF3800 domain-containing protein [Verrucomicrobiae bacterium]